jgi:hypothetical protein
MTRTRERPGAIYSPPPAAGVLRSELGIPDGVATLDVDGFVEPAQLSPSLVDISTFDLATNPDKMLAVKSDGTGLELVDAPTGGTVTWGDIIGTLADQLDLQTALATKLDDSQATAFGLSLLDDANAAAGRATLGLGNVDDTADAAKNVLSASKLTTARNINGVAFDGTGNITINAVDSTARVPETRTIGTTAPLSGGGDLSANRTLSITAATGAAAGSMSAADKTKLDAISGTNTGDQTSIVGITGTKAQFDTAVSDGNIVYVGDNITGSAATLTTSRNFSITGSGITAAAVGFNGSAAVALSASVDAGHITLARMADIATARFIGRVTAATGVPEAITGTQATTLLDTFTSALKGLAPASGGGTSNFLRADGTWTTPPAGGGIAAVKYDATGAALGAAIADYFTSSISLEAASIYEIEAHAYFLKTTAGTVIWTWAFSNAPTMATSRWAAGPITGFTTATVTGTELYGHASAEAVAAMAHAASGSLTTAVRHSFIFRVRVRTNLATTIQLRCTESAGTVTPQAGSYMLATKVV